MWGISYWILPLFASVVWLAMLLAMFLRWVTNGKPHYPSMDPSQRIAYISDVGAQELKPLFIAMSAVTVVCLDLAFILERWLRHKGRLAQNTSWFQKGLSIASIVCAIAGAAGMVLLAIFDTLRHPRLHNIFLAVFIVGYVLSAIFICWEYQRLGKHFGEHIIIRISFWIKLAFILIEVALAIAFGVSQNRGRYNTAAILEWVISLIFTFYVFSFFVDFVPAVRTKHHQSRETQVEMAYAESQDELHQPGATNGRSYNGVGNGYLHADGTSSYGNGVAPGRHVNGAMGNYHSGAQPNRTKPAEVPTSRNF